MKKEIVFEVVELEEKTYHPLIKAEFEGLENHWWVIDTGASKSVFDESLNDYYIIDNEDSVMATGLGKEVVETSSGKIAELKLGGYNFGGLKVALVDFHHINNEYAKFSDKKIVGLIGSDFLFIRKANIDYDQITISLIAD
jgi:hypothetical protein